MHCADQNEHPFLMALHCQSEYMLDSISQKCKENKKECQQIYVYVEH